MLAKDGESKIKEVKKFLLGSELAAKK